jgi:hypothetical protein
VEIQQFELEQITRRHARHSLNLHSMNEASAL